MADTNPKLTLVTARAIIPGEILIDITLEYAGAVIQGSSTIGAPGALELALNIIRAAGIGAERARVADALNDRAAKGGKVLTALEALDEAGDDLRAGRL